MHTLVVGAGFSGERIAKLASDSGSVCGTRQSQESVDQLQQHGIQGLVLKVPGERFDLPEAPDERLAAQLHKVTHLVICVAPSREQPLYDPILRLFGLPGQELPALEWVGYLSTIGVYGNHEGGWVNETTPCTSHQIRSIMRREAEVEWQRLAESWQVPLSILRLSGIYGPGRNAVKDAIAGRARMLIKPQQVFNRIHVDDLATVTMLCAHKRYAGILNITDDVPAAPQDVICFAHRLVGKPAPEAVAFDTADISEMARSFYSENKRVSNELSKKALSMQYMYPSYEQGLKAIWDAYQ